MGKVDQGVFTHWMLAHHFRPAALLHRLRRRTASRCATSSTSRTWSTWSSASCSTRTDWDGRTVERGRRPRVQPLAAGDDGDLPRADRQRGSDRARSPRRAQGDVPIYISDCARLFRADEWRPRRDAEQVLADIHEWIAADEERIAEALKSRPPRGRGSRRRCPLRSSPDAGGLIGSEAVEHFVAQGFDVVGIENDMRARFFGPESSTSHVTERLVDEHDSFQLGERRHPRRRPRSSGSSASTPADRAGHPHRRAAVPRLGRPRAADRLRGQRQRHPQPARGRARPLRPTPPSSSPRPTRSTATRRTGCRWSSWRRGWSCPSPTPTTRASTPSMSIDASHPLAVRGLEGGRRPAGAGVRPLFRHADRLLPRRLPDRAAARRRASCTASSPT